MFICLFLGPHRHDRDGEGRGITPEIKDMIEDLYSKGNDMPLNIMYSLRQSYPAETLPTTRQIKF